jgi:hypothetical protein
MKKCEDCYIGYYYDYSMEGVLVRQYDFPCDIDNIEKDEKNFQYFYYCPKCGNTIKYHHHTNFIQ